MAGISWIARAAIVVACVWLCSAVPQKKAAGKPRACPAAWPLAR